MWNNGLPTTRRGEDKTIIMPDNLEVLNSKCSACFQNVVKTQLEEKKLIYECRGCDWGHKECTCIYEEYNCTYIKCLKCIKKYECVICNGYDFNICIICNVCNICTNNNIIEQNKKISYIIDVKYSEKEDAKNLGAKWDIYNKTWYIPHNLDYKRFNKYNPHKYNATQYNPKCNISKKYACCFISCDKCGDLYYKQYIKKNDINENICETCSGKCDICKKMDNTILREKNMQYCEKCFNNKHNPSTDKDKYIAKIKNKEFGELDYYYLKEWVLEKTCVDCIHCLKKYWFVIDDNNKPQYVGSDDNFSKHQTWQRNDIKYLKNCCENCYNERHDKLLNDFIEKNPDPSNDEYIYKLDKYNFNWVKINFINHCIICDGRITVYLQYEKDKHKYKNCEKCNPSDKCHKYIYIKEKNNWILYKVRKFDTRHKWINPTGEFDENYYCMCNKCK